MHPQMLLHLQSFQESNCSGNHKTLSSFSLKQIGGLARGMATVREIEEKICPASPHQIKEIKKSVSLVPPQYLCLNPAGTPGLQPVCVLALVHYAFYDACHPHPTSSPACHIL